MSDSADTASFESVEGSQPVAAAAEGTQPVAASAGAAWEPQPSAHESAVGVAGGHPELIVGAAFVGGLVLAMLLKRLAS